MTPYILKLILGMTFLLGMSPVWAVEITTTEELEALLKAHDAAQEEMIKKLLSEQNTSFCAACAARNKAMIEALNVCIDTNPKLRTCMIALREAMKKVSP